jgi:ribosomal protein L11 methyltransferase
MMVATLLSLDLRGKRVLDCGCGTGILGIVALKLGAKEAVGYDIDEWSVENSKHNAIINMVEEGYTSLLGDASVLQSELLGQFNIVMANINRNILLADMHAFVERMDKGATLLLSGFYKADIPILVEAAAAEGLQLMAERNEGEWACLKLTK